MADRPGVTAALAVVLVTALSAGCATSEPASLAPTSAPVRPTPTALLTPGDPGCPVDAPPPGFPTELLPLPPGAELLVSCATQADGFWNISFNIRTTMDVAELLDTARQPLLAAGFAEQTDPPAAGAAALSTFSRAEGEVLNMAVLDDGTVRTLTIGGSVMTQVPDGNG
ncbi:MAG: hypothetical protein FWH11_00890 [Micrococcales bacterium]|nr:hypothetical protein [Micrococcales bacterium]